jgi:hypothetical protein
MVVLPNGESNHGSHANKIIQARLPEGHADSSSNPSRSMHLTGRE